MTGVVNPVRIRFDAPTKYTDDTPIPANGILRYEYRFTASADGSGPSTVIQDTDFTADEDGKQTASIPTTLAFGQWYVAGRTISRDNQPSAWSTIVPFEVRARTPNPPENFTVA